MSLGKNDLTFLQDDVLRKYLKSRCSHEDCSFARYVGKVYALSWYLQRSLMGNTANSGVSSPHSGHSESSDTQANTIGISGS